MPGAAQAPAVLTGIALWMNLVPAAGFLALAFVLRFYSLDEAQCARVKNDLTHRETIAVPFV